MDREGNRHESQRELKISANSLFSDRFPVWKCPDCGRLNRYVDTFFELCDNCGADHTLDWDNYSLNILERLERAGKRGAKAGLELRRNVERYM